MLCDVYFTTCITSLGQIFRDIAGIIIFMPTSESNESLSKELIVKNKMGIHARPAAMFVRIANSFAGDVWVEKDKEQVNGKSIMGLMMLAAGNGSKLVVRAEGSAKDAQRMLDQLESLFERRFEEI